jgi:hypothetical protein
MVGRPFTPFGPTGAPPDYPIMRSSWLVVTLALATVGILTVPGAFASGGATLGGSSAPAGGGVPGSNLAIDAFLTLGNGSGNLTSPILLGTTVTPRAPILPNQDGLVSATPEGAVLWPGGNAGDDLNPLGNYSAGASNGTGSTGEVLYTFGGHFVDPETTERDFVAWCRSINCTAIFEVPGELNDPSIARDIVAYTVNQTYTGPVWTNETEPGNGGTGNPLGIEHTVTMPGLDFRPAYWEVGNEPALWPHWDQPWGARTGAVNVTPAEYGQVVESYQLAMNQANSSYTARIIAPPGIGGISDAGAWLDDVLNDTGGNLAGIGMHVYVTGDSWTSTTTAPSMARFAQALTGPSGLYKRIKSQASTIAQACHSFGLNCNLPMFITELGTGLSHEPYGTYSATFPGALGVTIEAIQAMNFPASTIQTTNVFSTVSDSNNSWFNLSGAVRPSYTAYSQILNHLGNDAFPVGTFNETNGVRSHQQDSMLTAIATVALNDSDRRDLLVVNTNVTQPANFSTAFINSSDVSPSSPSFPATFKSGSPVEVWQWSGQSAHVFARNKVEKNGTNYTTLDPATPGPVPVFYPNGLPANFSVPPMSLALFETYNVPAYPVQFEESGLSLAPTNFTVHWLLDVDGMNTSSNSTNLTLLLPPGSYPTSATPVLVPTPGSVLVPKERYYPAVPSTTVVGSSPQTVIVSYVQQWALNISWNTSRGTVLAANLGGGPGAPPTWWNASAPLILQFRPQPGYALDVWAGEGDGSFTGYSVNATIAPTSPVEEQALFKSGPTVTFSEIGLPAGTPWTVSLRGFEEGSTSSTNTFSEINGVWGYTVANATVLNPTTGNLTTYRAERTVADVLVSNTPVNVVVDFAELFPITFTEQGLPMGANWSVIVANDTTVQTGGDTSGHSITVAEADGNWGFELPYVYPANTPGYRPTHIDWNGTNVSSTGGNVTLNGAPTTVQVTFVELTPNATRYPVYFTETNLAPGTLWTVTVANSSDVATTNSSTTQTLIVWEKDGKWGFTASAAGYHFDRTQGFFTVNNATTSVAVDFEYLYRITFQETGLPLPYDPPRGWNVSVATENPLETNGSSTGASLVLEEPNGTWGYLANAGPEYHFNRTLADITIAGHDVTVSVVFDLLTESTFVESGLLPGTSWPLEVTGFSGLPTWNNNSTVEKNVFETNGDWGFVVGNATTLNATGVLTRYHVVWTNWNGTEVQGHAGNYTVFNANVTIQVKFLPLPYSPITFTEAGLPTGTVWTVSVGLPSAVNLRNATNSTFAPDSMLLREQPGQYAFSAGAAGGYNVSSPLYFNNTGAPMSITVVFVPGNRVIWEETGLGPNLAWSVVLNGSTNVSAGVGWANDRLFNGTAYAFSIPVVQPVAGGPSYVPDPRVGTFDLTGAGLVLDVRFILVTYEVTLAVTGLPSGDQYQVRLSNVTVTTTLSSVDLARPNGTWSYDIVPPLGYYGAPQGGGFNVTGHSLVIPIDILPIGRGPTPPFWVLVAPAASTATVLGLSGLGVYALLGALRRRRTGAPL